MFKTIGEFEITHEKRLCIVNEKHGYFHCWEPYATVMAPGLTIGSPPGGQFSQVYAIVEFADGVERVDPSKIKFVDEDNAQLAAWDKYCNERKEADHV